jgi:hypothetical protein
VILTLSLGIGANAAIFTLVRGVLLKPLVNRDEDRLIYIRQSAPGIRDENATFSVPEIQDLRASVKTLSAFGDFSTMDFTMIGLGEPRSIRGGVVGGTYFDVMGLHPCLVASSDLKTTVLRLPASSFSPTVFGRPLFTRILRSSAKPFASVASVIALRQSLASSSLASHIPKILKSSPTWSPARIISPQPWSLAASIA